MLDLLPAWLPTPDTFGDPSVETVVPEDPPITWDKIVGWSSCLVGVVLVGVGWLRLIEERVREDENEQDEPLLDRAIAIAKKDECWIGRLMVKAGLAAVTSGFALVWVAGSPPTDRKSEARRKFAEEPRVPDSDPASPRNTPKHKRAVVRPLPE
jgi:hypothetical protein